MKKEANKTMPQLSLVQKKSQRALAIIFGIIILSFVLLYVSLFIGLNYQSDKSLKFNLDSIEPRPIIFPAPSNLAFAIIIIPTAPRPWTTTVSPNQKPPLASIWEYILALSKIAVTTNISDNTVSSIASSSGTLYIHAFGGR